MGEQVLYHGVLIDGEESGKMVWRDQKPERKLFLPKGKADLANHLGLIEFKFDPSDTYNPYHALIQGILTDAIDGLKPVRKYYGAIILPSENPYLYQTYATRYPGTYWKRTVGLHVNGDIYSPSLSRIWNFCLSVL